MKKNRLVILAILSIFGCGSLVCFFATKDQCTFIPVTFDTFCSPLAKIEIEGKSYSVKVDLGSVTQLSLNEAVLEKINKSTYGKTLSINFRGNEYEAQNYLIPKMKLGNILFNEVMVESKEPTANTIICGGREDNPTEKQGHIGWPLLKRNNLLLDFPHSRLAIVESAKQISYPLETMHKVPFELTGAGLTITVETELGKKRLVVDTGATLTVVRASGCGSQIYEKDEHRGLDYFLSYQFVIEGKNFSGMPLYLLDITPELRDIDGFLGMNFIKHHVIYIDFRKNALYISEKVD